ncbi:MAG: undecaprenyldiphospho-muramoylpentapeptide beta-N-acetylglucosaminyltransferase [Pseudomonadota bacterium]
MPKPATCVMIMAGGTGGHIYPALAVANALHAKNVKTIWLGSASGLENQIVPPHGIRLIRVFVAGLRGKGLVRWLTAPAILSIAVFQSIAAMLTERPGAVLGMGGFASGPGGIAAWLCRIPLVIHEQNAKAGSTNKILSRFATHVYQAFPDTFQSVAALTVGNPIRREIVALAGNSPREVNNGQVNILILGGSRGARYLNMNVPGVIAQIIPELSSTALSVRHQCGDNNLPGTKASYNGVEGNIEISPYIDDMAAAYRWADLVICRAGAMTVSELAAAGLGSILVPFPYATDDHQTANAAYLSANGAAEIVPEGEAFESRLTETLAQILANPSRITEMAEKAGQLAELNAANVVADKCWECVNV